MGIERCGKTAYGDTLICFATRTDIYGDRRAFTSDSEGLTLWERHAKWGDFPPAFAQPRGRGRGQQRIHFWTVKTSRCASGMLNGGISLHVINVTSYVLRQTSVYIVLADKKKNRAMVRLGFVS